MRPAYGPVPLFIVHVPVVMACPDFGVDVPITLTEPVRTRLTTPLPKLTPRYASSSVRPDVWNVQSHALPKPPSLGRPVSVPVLVPGRRAVTHEPSGAC